MNLLTYGSHATVWTNFPVFLMITCTLTPLHIIASSNHSSNPHAKPASSTRFQPFRRAALNGTARISGNNSSNSPLDVSPPETALAANQSSVKLDSSLSSTDLLAGGALLTDPSHPISGTPSVSTQISSQPTVVSTALLTDTTPFPSLNRNSSNDDQSQYNYTTPSTPVLSGSMTISLPTRTTTATRSHPTQPYSNDSLSMPSTTKISTSSPNVQNPTNNASLAPTGTVIINSDIQPSTPTTSTAVVYATNAPVSSRPAPTTNSFGYRNLASSFHISIGLAVIVLSF